MWLGRGRKLRWTHWVSLHSCEGGLKEPICWTGMEPPSCPLSQVTYEHSVSPSTPRSQVTAWLLFTKNPLLLLYSSLCQIGAPGSSLLLWFCPWTWCLYSVALRFDSSHSPVEFSLECLDVATARLGDNWFSSATAPLGVRNWAIWVIKAGTSVPVG